MKILSAFRSSVFGRRVAAVLVGSCLLSFGCVSTRILSSDKNSFVVEGKVIEAKLADTLNLVPSKKFWFAPGDDRRLTYGWVEVVLQEPQRRCMLCADTCDDSTDPGGLTAYGISDGSLVKTTNNQSAELHVFHSLLDACLNRPPNTFTTVMAEDDTVYDLQHRDPFLGEDAGFTRSHFFETQIVSSAEDLRKNMVRYTDPSDPPTVRFRYSVSDPALFDENFSNSLKITRVRFLLATRNPQTDVVMLSEDTAALKKARPSQVWWVKDFIEGQSASQASNVGNRCYLDPALDDGGFNLADCRSDPPNSGNAGVRQQHNVKPTYAEGFPQATLSWFIEYRASDGLPAAEAFGANEFPVIVWTISVL